MELWVSVKPLCRLMQTQRRAHHIRGLGQNVRELENFLLGK